MSLLSCRLTCGSLHCGCEPARASRGLGNPSQGRMREKSDDHRPSNTLANPQRFPWVISSHCILSGRRRGECTRSAEEIYTGDEVGEGTAESMHKTDSAYRPATVNSVFWVCACFISSSSAVSSSDRSRWLKWQLHTNTNGRNHSFFSLVLCRGREAFHPTKRKVPALIQSLLYTGCCHPWLSTSEENCSELWPLWCACENVRGR